MSPAIAPSSGLRMASVRKDDLRSRSSTAWAGFAG